jgi:hypothetical protein
MVLSQKGRDVGKWYYCSRKEMEVSSHRSREEMKVQGVIEVWKRWRYRVPSQHGK